MNQERDQYEADPAELEGGGEGQTWGQGEGRHEPTIPADEADDADETPTSYSDGRPTKLDDRNAPLSRETEGMER
jgi:hypothetical protein